MSGFSPCKFKCMPTFFDVWPVVLILNNTEVEKL